MSESITDEQPAQPVVVTGTVAKAMRESSVELVESVDRFGIAVERRGRVSRQARKRSFNVEGMCVAAPPAR